MDRVVVVGAGVNGLSCALRLIEAGHRVDVLARDLPQETTSTIAAALWAPYLVQPQQRVTAWARTSYDEFARLEKEGAPGVRLLPGTEVHHEPAAESLWAEAVSDPTPVTVAGFASAWTFVAPVIETPVYLAWLAERVLDAGGTITRMALAALPEAPLVVNCAGLGSRHLAGDPTVQPVRGQVLLVEQFGLDRWWLEESGPTYVVPRGQTVVLGGTSEAGDWSRTASAEQTADIVARASRLVPEVARARILRRAVGLRPGRPEVRLERAGDVIHCYGHGGAGITLSWGCAAEVAELAG